MEIHSHPAGARPGFMNPGLCHPLSAGGGDGLGPGVRRLPPAAGGAELPADLAAHGERDLDGRSRGSPGKALVVWGCHRAEWPFCSLGPLQNQYILGGRLQNRPLKSPPHTEGNGSVVCLFDLLPEFLDLSHFWGLDHFSGEFLGPISIGSAGTFFFLVCVGGHFGKQTKPSTHLQQLS